MNNNNNNSNWSSSSSEGRHDDESALVDFLSSLMDYTPTIPDELVEHYLAKSGFQCPDDKRLILTMEDLSMALREYGVNLKRQEYFADNPSTGLESTSRDES